MTETKMSTKNDLVYNEAVTAAGLLKRVPKAPEFIHGKYQRSLNATCFVFKIGFIR